MTDPIRERRALIGRLADTGQRFGYICFGVAIVAFFVGLIGEFTDTVVTIVVAAMAIGSVVLAPAIVFGYAVKAAEREDRERGL